MRMRGEEARNQPPVDRLPSLCSDSRFRPYKLVVQHIVRHIVIHVSFDNVHRPVHHKCKPYKLKPNSS